VPALADRGVNGDRLPRRQPPWRVFISHTRELAEYPAGGSFVAAVQEAVSALGHVVVEMGGFAARDQAPSALCEEKVAGSDVYVGVLGLRYGSPVRDQPDRSYTELEFGCATTAGLPRLMFVLDGASVDHGIPLDALFDVGFDRQKAFRERVREAGLTLAPFRNATDLGRLVERALHGLAQSPDHGDAASGAAQPRADVPRPGLAAVARSAKLDELVARLLAGTSATVTSLVGAGGAGKTVLAQQAGRDERIRAAYPGGRWWMTMGEHPDLERLAVELYRKLSGGRQPAAGVSAVTQLGDAVSDQPVLVILDDVWPPTGQVEQLVAALPANAHCLVTWVPQLM
jgi:Domain of unknown function (DUF4062)/NB-ARC domain